MVPVMKRWSTILLVVVTFSALLFMAVRWMAPVMGLGGIENEWLQTMSRLMPFAAMAGTTSIVFLVLTFRWKPKPAYPEAKRLVEEAEQWSEKFVIGDELERQQQGYISDSLFNVSKPFVHKEASPTVEKFAMDSTEFQMPTAEQSFTNSIAFSKYFSLVIVIFLKSNNSFTFTFKLSTVIFLIHSWLNHFAFS